MGWLRKRQLRTLDTDTLTRMLKNKRRSAEDAALIASLDWSHQGTHTSIAASCSRYARDVAEVLAERGVMHGT